MSRQIIGIIMLQNMNLFIKLKMSEKWMRDIIFCGDTLEWKITIFIYMSNMVKRLRFVYAMCLFSKRQTLVSLRFVTL